MKWHVGYRTSIIGIYHQFIACDDLRVMIEAAQLCVSFRPDRQVAIFRHRMPTQWYYGRRHYIYGPSDNDLHRQFFGEDMPISATAKNLINNVSSTSI